MRSYRTPRASPLFLQMLCILPIIIPTILVSNGLLRKVGKAQGWLCTVCGKRARQKSNVARHIQSKHVAIRFACPLPLCRHVNNTGWSIWTRNAVY